MTDSPTRIPLFPAAIGVLAVGALTAYVFADRGPDLDAILVSCEWARLAPLPASAHHIETEVAGNAFSRRFVVRFTASEPDIEAWLNTSPGTRDVGSPHSHSIFKIQPGGGAALAEVHVDWNTGCVTIRAEWS